MTTKETDEKIHGLDSDLLYLTEVLKLHPGYESFFFLFAHSAYVALVLHRNAESKRVFLNLSFLM